MLFRSFSTNKEIVMFLLPLVALAFWWIPMFWGLGEQAPYQAPLFSFFSGLLSSSWLAIAVSFILVVGSGLLLNRVLIFHELYPKTTYLPALFYTLLSSLYFFQLSLHPLVFANLLVVLALNQMLGIYRQQSAKTRIFNAGMFLSTGVLFFFPLALATPVLFMALIIIRPFVWREWLLAIIGLALPVIFAMATYYAMGWPFPEIEFEMSLDYINQTFLNYEDTVGTVLWGAIVFTFLVSLWHFGKVRSRASNRLRKLMFLIGLYGLLLYGAYVASSMMDEVASRFGIVLVPLAIFFTYPAINAKRKWIPYLLYYSIIAGSIVNYWQFFSGS